MALAAALAALSLCASASADHGFTELVSAGGNGPHTARFGGASEDGLRLFFETTESLSATDTDTGCSSGSDDLGCVDVYERADGVTTLVSTGPSSTVPAANADFKGSSADGLRVFFDTRDALVPEDTDNCFGTPSGCRDIYERSGGTTTLVSTGPVNANGPDQADFVGMSKDGTRIFFLTRAGLVPADTDGATDLYERSGGTTTLVSVGPVGNGPNFPTFGGASADGTRVFFETRDALVASDTDACGDVIPPACSDVYERSGGTTTLVSTGPAGGNGNFPATFSRASTDGTRVFFRTEEKLVGADTDARFDLYERSSGTTQLISTGSIGGNANIAASFGGISRDGTRVFFLTAERLESADFDGHIDVYERSGGNTTLVSTAPVSGGHGPVTFGGASADGTHVFFMTEERLAVEDDDLGVRDVYERFAGTTSIVSYSPMSAVDESPATFRGSSDNGFHVFFTTGETLVPYDTGGSDIDIYERAGGGVTLISTGPGEGNTQDFGLEPTFHGVTPTGTRVFFENLGNIGANDADNCSAGAPSSFFPCRDVYVSILRYVRPNRATPLRVSLVPAFAACTSPDRAHGPPLTFASCAAPAQTSASVTVGTPDANGAATRFVGSIRLDVLGGPGPPEDSDVRIVARITDARCHAGVTTCGPANAPGGSDYTGEVRGTADLRITDRLSGALPVDQAMGTMVDTPLSFDLSCSPTASTAEGSTCSATTSVDALTPGAVPEGVRSVWQLGQVRVLDGGPDGDTATGPNTLFAVQGLFVP